MANMPITFTYRTPTMVDDWSARTTSPPLYPRMRPEDRIPGRPSSMVAHRTIEEGLRLHTELGRQRGISGLRATDIIVDEATVYRETVPLYLRVCSHPHRYTMYTTVWTRDRTMLIPFIKCSKCGSVFEKDTSNDKVTLVNTERIGKHPCKLRVISYPDEIHSLPLKKLSKEIITNQFKPLDYY